MAMDYNEYGEPVLRVVTSQSTLTGGHTTGANNYFGEALAIPLVPVVQLNSYEGIKERDAQVYQGAGGTVTEADNLINISCSSTLGSYGVYRSRRFIPYRAGETNTARLLVKFGTPQAGTQQRAGVANQENGYFIGFNGTSFQFLHTYGGKSEIRTLALSGTASTNQTLTVTLNGTAYTVAILSGDTANIAAQKVRTAISDSVWLGDQVDNTVRFLSGTLGPKSGTYSLTSTGNITGTFTQRVAGITQTDEWSDITLPSWCISTNWNHWQFQYTWNGVNVFVLNQQTNNWYLVYRHGFDLGTVLPVSKPSFKTTSVVYNVGGSTPVTMNVASMAGFVEGIQELTTYTHGGGVTKTSLSSNTYHHIMSIQNPYVADSDNWRINFRHIKFLDLTVAGQVNDPVELYIFYEGQLANGAVFDYNSFPNRLYQASTTNATFNASTDTPVCALVLGLSGSQAQFDLKDYNLVLPPGAQMSLVAYSTASIQKLTIGGVWGSIG